MSNPGSFTLYTCLCGVFAFDSGPPLDVYVTVDQTTDVTFEGAATYTL